jgi:hypothetical protein
LRLTRRTGTWIGAGIAVATLGCAPPPVAMVGAPIEPIECSDDSHTTDSVFLIGDAGDPKLPDADSNELIDPVLLSLNEHIGRRIQLLGEDRVSTVFLGDNVYWNGLPPEAHKDRRERERKLEAQIAASAPSRAVFLLGNHDWDVDGPEGWIRALEQRRFLQRFAPRVETKPLAGCTGPGRLDVGEWLRIIFTDQAAFEHVHRRPEEHATQCPEDDDLEAFLRLSDEFDHPDGRHMALALHHPLVTAGPHGGHYTWKQHLFPLTDFWSWAWLPLPIIGSVYPLSRGWGASDTDITSAAYDRMVRSIFRAARPLAPQFFIGGHEHSLQVHRDVLDVYYLVSGAGSSRKVDRVERMPTLMFAAARPGYMRLDVHDDGALRVGVFAVERGAESEVFRHCLASGPPALRPPPDPSLH